MLAPASVLQTLVDVGTGAAGAPVNLDAHAGSRLKVDDVEADEAGLDRVGQVHNRLGRAVQNSELNLKMFV